MTSSKVDDDSNQNKIPAEIPDDTTNNEPQEFKDDSTSNMKHDDGDNGGFGSQPYGGGGMGGMGGNYNIPTNIPSVDNRQFNDPRKNTGPTPSSNRGKQPPTNKPSSTPSQYGDINDPKFKKFESKVVACAEAEKIMKQAFAAMKFNDLHTVVEKLKESIAMLQPHKD